MTNWTLHNPCQCVELLKTYGATVDPGLSRMPQTGNRLLGTFHPVQIKNLIQEGKFDIHSVDAFGHSTLSYVLALAMSKHCLENVRVLLKHGCTVQNSETLARALIFLSNGHFEGMEKNGCMLGVPILEDMEYFRTSDHINRYSAVLKLLSIAGMRLQSVEKVEWFRLQFRSQKNIKHLWEYKDLAMIGLEAEKLENRRKSEKYVDPCEYGMEGVESVPSLQSLSGAVIRKQLMEVDSQTNLFVSVPKLPITRPAHDILLYHTVL